MSDPIPQSGAEATGSPQSSTALATTGDTLQVFSGIAAFDAAQRMAKALCSSTLVPRDYQGQQGLANSLIALEIAGRMRLSPLVVMQNMTPIHGRPTWSSKFLIATVNASGRFSPLRFVFDDKENPSRCHAVATDKATGEVLEGETITLELARKEGWWSRKDRQGNETSKWQTMTGQMLRYRAAAWWANVYCPEIALGLMTQEEALDIEPVTVREAGGPMSVAPASQGRALPEADEESPVQARAQAVAEKPTTRRRATAGTPAAAPQPLRHREGEDHITPDQNDGGGDALPNSSDTAAVADAVIEAEIVDAEPQQPELASAAPRRSRPPTKPGRTEGPAAEGPAASGPTTSPDAAPLAAVAASASEEDRAPVRPDAQHEPPSEEPPAQGDPVEAGLRQIPRIATLLDLDVAYGRVNQLLSSGRINDHNAERLWSAIARRRRQLETAEASETDTSEAGA